jgi:hypothetical protein
LLIPVAAVKADDDDHKGERRYYDPAHRDYHVWNSREDQAYRRYLRERNREYREYNAMKKREQRQYWNWRHEHHDDDMERRAR